MAAMQNLIRMLICPVRSRTKQQHQLGWLKLFRNNRLPPVPIGHIHVHWSITNSLDELTCAICMPPFALRMQKHSSRSRNLLQTGGRHDWMNENSPPIMRWLLTTLAGMQITIEITPHTRHYRFSIVRCLPTAGMAASTSFIVENASIETMLALQMIILITRIFTV